MMMMMMMLMMMILATIATILEHFIYPMHSWVLPCAVDLPPSGMREWLGINGHKRPGFLGLPATLRDRSRSPSAAGDKMEYMVTSLLWRVTGMLRLGKDCGHSLYLRLCSLADGCNILQKVLISAWYLGDG